MTNDKKKVNKIKKEELIKAMDMLENSLQINSNSRTSLNEIYKEIDNLINKNKKE